MDFNSIPWYQSSAGPGVSLTLTGIAGTFVPIVDLVLSHFGIIIPGLGETVNAVIAAGVFLVFATVAAVGYLRAKFVHEQAVGALRQQVTALGHVPRV